MSAVSRGYDRDLEAYKSFF